MKVRFSGPLQYRVLAAAGLSRSLTRTGLRRAAKGPRLPGWNWSMELNTEVVKDQLATAFQMPIKESRCYLDAVQLDSPALSRVRVMPIAEGRVKGSWFVPQAAEPKSTLFYLHGGGYSYYPKAYAGLIALIALKVKMPTFALDYRLTPEHRFPAQLDDAVNAYEWLLDSGVDAHDLVVAGDSAGGNLTIALLLAARDRKLPLPRLAVALSPATDFSAADREPGGGSSLVDNEPYDWIQTHMLLRWADWFCDSRQRMNPLVSPIYADLHGLPPLYIQAGRAEILYDSIEAFAHYAKEQGANVVLESWADMNHDFLMFGGQVPQAAEALRRLCEVINAPVESLKEVPRP